MHIISKGPGARFLVAVLAVSVAGSVSAQDQQPPQDSPDSNVVVYGASAPAMTAGPEVKGVIAARHGDKMKVTTADGTSMIIAVNDATRIKAGGGLFGGGRGKLAADALLNGMPVTVKTLQAGDGQAGGELMASQISFRKSDLKTATMIRNGDGPALRRTDRGNRSAARPPGRYRQI